MSSIMFAYIVKVNLHVIIYYQNVVFSTIET